MGDQPSYERYQRQTLLKEFGEGGQLKLFRAKVLVIGAGGLGCPALQYLAAAGVGCIGIVDSDTVSLSNLHRQPIYQSSQIGLPKVECVAKFLQALNPEVSIIAHHTRVTNLNAFDIIQSYDIVVDGSDNFATRYLVNDACVLLKKPLVFGAVSQFEGQLAVFNFNFGNEISVNYRDLFPDPPKESDVLNCAEAGVIGVLPGIIGAMLAGEVIKIITGIGDVLKNRLYIVNVLSNQSYEIKLAQNPRGEEQRPKSRDELELINYEWLCASEQKEIEIGAERFFELINTPGVSVIDVREPHEKPRITSFEHLQIPLSGIKENELAVADDTIVFICQTGKRSLEAAQFLSSLPGNNKTVYSLRGGIVNLNMDKFREKI